MSLPGRIVADTVSPITELDQARALVAEDMARVDAFIRHSLRSDVVLIRQVAEYIIGNGGKRLRPLIHLLAARAFGYEGENHIRLAAIVEFIHTATLLHDDVVDESDLRRGQDTANAVWGNQASVLVGDFLFSRAFQLMVADGSLKTLKILSDASAIIAEGEVRQLITTNDVETTEAAYLEVIENKTAELFAAAARIGAVVADRPEDEEARLEAFGRNLGVAFQLVDDVLDYDAEQATLGKTVGDDFREGKVTLPVILAYHAGDAEQKAFWHRVIDRLEQSGGDLEHAQALMDQHHTLRTSLERARDYAEVARGALDWFAPTTHRDALEELVDFCVERAY